MADLFADQEPARRPETPAANAPLADRFAHGASMKWSARSI